MSAKNHSTKSMKNFDHLDAMRYALKLPENQLGLGVSCKSGTFSLIFYYIPLYHILVTGHPYHIRTPR